MIPTLRVWREEQIETKCELLKMATRDKRLWR